MLPQIAASCSDLGTPEKNFEPCHRLHKKWSSPLNISSVNVAKSSVSCGFGHIYRKNP